MRGKCIAALCLFLCLILADLALAAERMPASCDAVDTLKDRQIPIEITKHLKDWWFISNADRILQIVLGVVGVLCSLIVSTFTTALSPNQLKAVSFVAALAFGMITAFDIGGKADNARGGWCHLTIAILRYQNEPCFGVSKLIDAYSEGEALVGNVPLRALGSASNAAGSSAEEK